MRSLCFLVAAACTPTLPTISTHPSPATVDEDRFADDLRHHLVGWYDVHAGDVASAGGSTLADATAAVDPAEVSWVAPADDPLGYDPATTHVLSHPDVVFVGSDRVWFGAYDRVSGDLVELTDWE